MRCSSLHPPRWPTGVLWYGHVPTAARHAEAPAATGTHEACRQAGTSTAPFARDCRRSSASAAVMQVRPLPVASGTAGSSLFGRSPFGTLG